MKTFHVRGTTVPGAIARFDNAIKAFMTAANNDIRGGAFAVAKDGRLVLAHGYTFAEKNYPITYPTARFRIGSASKILTGVGIHQLNEAGLVDPDGLDTKVHDILQLQLPDGSDPTEAFKQVTVRHLLQHRGGWDRNTRELTFQSDVDVAGAFGHSVPVTVEELMRWGLAQPTQFTPGTVPPAGVNGYSNFGYLLLGAVIAAKRGMSCEKAMKKHLFNALGIRLAGIGGSLLQDRLVDEVKYHQHPASLKPSAVHADRHDVPLQYGGENFPNKEGYGGWVLSAVDMVRVLVALQNSSPIPNTALNQQIFWRPKSSLNLPAGVTAFRHGATVGGSFGVAGLRSDGIAYAGFWNTKHDSEPDWSFEFEHPSTGVMTTYTDHEVCWNDIANKIESDGDWPSYDLFDQLFPPSDRWDVRIDEAHAVLEIKTLHTNGQFKGTITLDAATSAVEGFWNGATKELRFLRVADPAKPSTFQSFHGCLMENVDTRPVIRTFAGALQAFAGSGGTAGRNVFSWAAVPSVFVDSSSIAD